MTKSQITVKKKMDQGKMLDRGPERRTVGKYWTVESHDGNFDGLRNEIKLDDNVSKKRYKR